jgi:hypothetical protein
MMAAAVGGEAGCVREPAQRIRDNLVRDGVDMALSKGREWQRERSATHKCRHDGRTVSHVYP